MENQHVVDTSVSLTDLMALKLAGGAIEKHRESIPEGMILNVARQYEIVGTLSTGKVSVRKLPGDARQVLCWALALMEPHQLLALRQLVGDKPSAEQLAVASGYLDAIARETLVSPPVRGVVTVEVLG
jgi:hypothetical protein